MTDRLRAAIIFLALAVLHTWPLASAPHRLSLNDNADAQLNTWIISWIAHTLPTHPTALWYGNIFQLGEQALRFSEPLVVPALAGAPIVWLGGTGHWRPTANGYSGLTPPSYRKRSETLWYFPEQRAVDTLLALGATHAMVHLERFAPHEIPGVIRAMEQQHNLRLLAADLDGHRPYRVVRE